MHGGTFGELLWLLCYFDLNIETEENDENSIAVTFRLPNNWATTLIASGEYWTERTYKHPETGKPFYPTEEEVSDFEDQTGIELELADAEVAFIIKIEGRIDLERQ